MIPRTLYHGTPTGNIKAILTQGLRVGTSERANFDGYQTNGIVFMAGSEKDARFFGSAAAMERGDKTLDFSVLAIDADRAMAEGCIIAEAPGLVGDFEAPQYVSVMDIPPSCVMRFKRVYIGEGRVKEETFNGGS